MQSSGLTHKHSLPGSPTNASPLGPPPKKQAQRGPLLPTPEAPVPYMRQGRIWWALIRVFEYIYNIYIYILGSGGSFHPRSSSDSYHPTPHPPYTPTHHIQPSGIQRAPYQDQRVQVHAHQVPQDIHMQGVHSSHPSINPQSAAAAHGITYIQQPQYQG